MTLFARSVISAALLIAASDAVGCETDADISQLPGETLADATQRFKDTFAAQSVIRSYEKEKFALDKAQVIYVAKVLKSVRAVLGGRDNRPSATVQPIGKIKGKLPSSDRRLAITSENSCFMYGDGEGAMAKTGTLVLVFEGLPKSEWHPNGITSILATNVRSYDLLDALYPFGKSIPHPSGD